MSVEFDLDDDVGVSPRALEQRRTGFVKPLDAGEVMMFATQAPMDLACLGLPVTPETIAQRVRSQVERGVASRAYGWPSDADYQKAMSDEELEELCLLFERRYGNGSEFREDLTKSEMRELIRSCSDYMFEPYARRIENGIGY